jgi:hypothetical protein
VSGWSTDCEALGGVESVGLGGAGSVQAAREATRRIATPSADSLFS